jgi:DNA-binding NtrC family response regulator
MTGGHTRGTEQLAVLLVTADDQQETSLRAILDGFSHAMVRVASCTEAAPLLDDLSPSVVLVEADLPAGEWRCLLDRRLNLPSPAEVIVFSRSADVCLWAEVLTLGGYDLLEVPFDPEEVRRMVSQASHARTRDLSSGAFPPSQAASSATAA